jgi:transmembrane sensor
MQLDINNPEHSILLARNLSGEMEESEYLDFKRSISETEENVQLLKSMEKQWKTIGESKISRSPDTGEAWSRLHSRLENETLIPSQDKVKKVYLRGQLLRIAALLLVLFSAGYILFWSIGGKQSNPQMVRLNTNNDPLTLVKTLADGSIIYLAGNTSFSFPREFATDKRNVELKGEAFFDIFPNADKPFIIETGEATIQVLGTAFNVRTGNSGEFELLVDRGKVKVTMKKGASVSEFVTAGQKIVIKAGRLEKSVFKVKEQPTWYTRHMHFKDETLRNFFNVLNRNFNTTFALADPETGNRRLTYTYDNESSESLTEQICLSLNLKSQVRNDSIVISEFKTGARKN